MQVVEKGILTISILVILTTLLLILLAFDESILRTHRATINLRKNYLENSFELQTISRQDLSQLCKELSFKNSKKTYKIILKNPLKKDRTNDTTSGTVWCKRHFLFKKSPKKSIYQGKLNDYVDTKQLQILKDKLIMPENNLPKSKIAKLYWFPADHQQWEINNDLYGVVIAENNLTILGKGKIRGVIITSGNLTLAKEVKVAYKKSVISSIIKQYSQWQLAPKSWYDFND